MAGLPLCGSVRWFCGVLYTKTTTNPLLMLSAAQIALECFVSFGGAFASFSVSRFAGFSYGLAIVSYPLAMVSLLARYGLAIGSRVTLSACDTVRACVLFSMFKTLQGCNIHPRGVLNVENMRPRCCVSVSYPLANR